MINIFIEIFLVGFFINLLWEVCHSQLYETCINLPLKEYVPLIIKASLKDGFFVTLFYWITVLIFRNVNILENHGQLLVFLLIGLIFAFIDERVSVKLKRWQYSRSMPTILGVGITPLLEISLTGLLAFLFVFI